MRFIKVLLFLLFTAIYMQASIKKDIVYVENLDDKTLNLKDEFKKPNNQLYTIALATLDYTKNDPIEYFKQHNLKNALAYKTGKDNNIKIISGVYNTYNEAVEALSKLDESIKSNNPYINKIHFHQEIFKQSDKIKQSKPNTTIKETNNSIYISGSKKSEELKKEFFNKDSKYYSIAIASIPLTKTSIKNFMEKNNISDGALAHVYGKDKSNVRIIFGLYKTRKEAQEAIKQFNEKIRSNSPFSMRMEKFQSFYKKSFPNNVSDDSVVELKIKNKKDEEKASKPKLNENIKIVKNDKPIKIEKKVEVPKKPVAKEPKKQEVKKEAIKKKVEPKKEVVKPITKQNIKKVIENESNKLKFLKESSLKDVYFIESDGSFNILSEVFLNEQSSFYTIDLGELKLKDISIEEFYEKEGLKNNSLAYKYGDKNEYARVIYGAYETKEEAKNEIKYLPVKDKKEIKISNIKNHQKLYKTFHKDIPKIEIKPNLPKDILYLENKHKNLLKDEFFNKNSDKYTITIVTIPKDKINIDNYLYNLDLQDDVLVTSIGTSNDYFRIYYGVYNSFNEARFEMSVLSSDIRNNNPYVSRLKTVQKKFESYNQRKIEDYIDNTLKIDLK